eukprot:190708_1
MEHGDENKFICIKMNLINWIKNCNHYCIGFFKYIKQEFNVSMGWMITMKMNVSIANLNKYKTIISNTHSHTMPNGQNMNYKFKIEMSWNKQDKCYEIDGYFSKEFPNKYKSFGIFIEVWIPQLMYSRIEKGTFKYSAPFSTMQFLPICKLSMLDSFEIFSIEIGFFTG